MKENSSARPRVLVLHTGGTLGMRGKPLKPDAFSTALTEAVPEINELADLEVRIVFNLDSSDIGPTHWTQLAAEIDKSRHDFDGFVVVHGTDTMAYTACALSFALLHLGKPVILTGAQRPLASVRTDARRNLVDAVEVATSGLGVVGICFDGLLLRGVRTTKSNVNDYRAFESPGAEPVARLGVDVVYAPHQPPVSSAYVFRPEFDPRVMALHVAPGFPSELLAELVEESDLKGLVLAAYGLGTVPTAGPDVGAFVERAVGAGLDVLVITQSAGKVDLSRYPNGRALKEAGAIAGGEMTIEAAVTKMMHAVAQFPQARDRQAYLLANVCGELGD